MTATPRLRPLLALPLLALALSGCTGGPDEDSSPAAPPATGTLAITLDGETTEFTPTIVRCEGEPGTLRHLELREAEDEMPLIEVAPGEFAMVKLVPRGEPEKNESSTDGITADEGTVTFADAAIGDAVVSGTIECPGGVES